MSPTAYPEVTIYASTNSPIGVLPAGNLLKKILCMDKYERRRQRLLILKKTRCDDNAAELARVIGREPSYVTRMLYPDGKAGKKRIGDDMMELIESKFELPRGWMDDIESQTKRPPLPRLTADQLMLAEIYPTLPAEKRNEMLDRMAEDPARYRALLDALLTEVAYSAVRAKGGSITWDGVERRKQVPNHG